MKMTTYTFDKEKAEEFAALAMTETIECLVRHKHMTDAEGDEFLDTHTAVVVTQNQLMKRLRALLFKDDSPDTLKICVVKIRAPKKSDSPPP